MSSLFRRLAHAVLLLDGPTGTELERRGYPTRLPLWTAKACFEAPSLLRNIHDDYIDAGADILTACTFRTTRHTLAKAGLGRDAVPLTRDAVAIARDAASAAKRTVLVAGSVAPLEDCYAPSLTPDTDTLAREHGAHIDVLAGSGADVLLVETMPTKREAEIAARAAVATGLPVIVSLLARDGATVFDGTPLTSALESLVELPIDVVAVNCCSAQVCTNAMPLLSRSGKPFGAYANAGEPDGSFGRDPEPLDVRGYADAVRGWLAAGSTLVGGCCGTQPEHIAALRAIIDERDWGAP